MAGPSLGINLTALVDYSTAFPFIDQFKMSRHWFTQSPGTFDTGQDDLLDLDANGWIRGFTKNDAPAPFDHVSTILFTNGEVVKPGIYILDWKGEGTLDLTNVPSENIISISDHKIVFRHTTDEAIGLNLMETDPNDNGNYIRDIRVYHQQDADLIAAGVTFNPLFLEKIQDFRVLRFMDWMNTNNSQISEWSDWRPADAANQTADGSGASVEVMVALANQTNADPWFTFPAHATDEFMREFAIYVRDNLEPGLVARFEYSNEVWNFGFEQAQWAQRQAEATWGEDIQGGWMQWYGVQAARMANIVADVFGAQTGTRALNVFSTQSGWLGLEHYALDAPDYVAEGGTPPRDAPFHVYAIAPYFGASLGDASHSAQVNLWLTQGETGFRNAIAYLRSGDGRDTLAHIGEAIAYHSAVAEALGWQLEAYEGGQHVVDLSVIFGGTENPAQTRFYEDLVKRPEFAALYREYFNIWHDNGGGLMAHFSDFGLASKYGSWGIWDSVYSDNSPRADAVEAFRDGIDAWWADNRAAASFENGHLLADYDNTGVVRGGVLGDALFGLDGADQIFGGRGSDLLSGGVGGDRLVAGVGNDMLIGGIGADVLVGGEGSDTASWATTAAAIIVNLLNRSTVGGASGDVLYSIENLTGGGGNDRLIGANDANILAGGLGDDFLAGNGGNDLLSGGEGQDQQFGGDGRDRLLGGNGRDIQSGGDGADTLFGGNGNDRLIGGAGGDALTGGAGADYFVFGPSDIGLGSNGDNIVDLTDQDTIQLQMQLRWMGTAQFTTGTQGAVRYTQSNGADATFLFFDLNGDAVSDGTIKINGLVDLSFDQGVSRID